MSAGCKECEALLERRWDGETLSPDEDARVSAHLAACEACTELTIEVDGLLDVAADLRDLTYDRAVEVAPLVLQPNRRRPLAWAMGLGWVTAALLAGLYLGRGAEAPAPVAAQDVMVRFAVPVAAANSVEVVGDFTGWEKRIPLTANADGMWVGQVRMQPGRYHYVIVVDGERMEVDPTAPQVVDDGFGGKNSVLDVGSI
jgi:hypothetical protein